MNWGRIIGACSLVTSIGVVILIWLQVRAARMERLESLWDFLFQSASKQAEEMGEKEKLKDITDKDTRRKSRRNRHLYLERIEEALRIEKPKKWEFWDKELKKRHKRVQEWYWKALNVYGDDIQVFKDVKIWHDYSSGELDPSEIGFRILNFLADGKKEQEEIVKEVVDKVFGDLRIEIIKGNIRKKAEQKLKDRLQDLKDFGFIKCSKECWELSKDGKGVIGKKSK